MTSPYKFDRQWWLTIPYYNDIYYASTYVQMLCQTLTHIA